jgi:putative inorganic carbon (HCO3(-)) transporter
MLRGLFVLSLLGAGFAGAMWSRHVALLTYVWIALFRPFEWIYLDLTSFRPSLVAGLVLLVPCLLTGQFPNASHPISVGMWMFAAAVLAAQLTSAFAADWNWVDQFIRLVVVSGLAVTLLTTRERLTQFVAVLAGSIAFFSAKAGVVSMLGGGVRFSDGQAGAFIDNNGYALAISMAIPLMAASALTLRTSTPFDRPIRAGFLLAIPLSIFTIIGTMSRGGILALVTVALTALLLQRRRLRASFAAVVLAALLYQVAPIPEGYFDRIETIGTYEEVEDASALSRLHFWRVAAVMAADNPVGVGLRNFERAFNRYDFLHGTFLSGRSVHSSHFQVLAEVGYLGLALWVFLFVWALVLCLRTWRAADALPGLSAEERGFYRVMSTSLATSMIAFLVGGGFIALANNDLTWLTFAAVAALDRQLCRKRSSATAGDPAAVACSPQVLPRRRSAVA